MARRDDRRRASSRRHGRSFSGRESTGRLPNRAPDDATVVSDGEPEGGERASTISASDSAGRRGADDRDRSAPISDPPIAVGDTGGDGGAPDSERGASGGVLTNEQVVNAEDDDAGRDESQHKNSRRDSGAEQAQPRQRRVRGRRHISGTMRLVITAAAVVLLVVLAITAYASPLMSVRTFHVNGLHELQRDRIIELARIHQGTPLLQVDTRPAATRIAALTRVKSVRVSRNYPSSIDINITERVAVALLNRDGATHLVDVDGIDFATTAKPPTLPRLEGTTDPSTPASKAALAVVNDLPPSLHRITQSVTADSPANVRLMLTDKRSVVWGEAHDDAAKSRSLSYLLTQRGTEYNVSAPQYPTYR